MRYGFVFPGGDVLQALACAEVAEAAGWDAFFVWDAAWCVDPWVTLAAVAVRTTRIRLGTMLTPVSRRRPWKLASETATLDRLSGGRLTLAVGLGAVNAGFETFGEVTDRRARAELLDEGLDILTGLWAGQPFSYSGKHYQVKPSDFPAPPPPVQRPRIPIWCVGAWPSERSMARALRYDGLLPELRPGPDGKPPALAPETLREIAAWTAERRGQGAPFDIVVEGETPGDAPELAAAAVRPLAEAGATWWLETRWGLMPESGTEAGQERIRARVRQGPPTQR
jgi:alkanesulfonate monooxygenase SsuD/methylene tetrahydromethanopterin reductase-like flavin-dependent oxidoreductase (luciferase family)